MFEHVSDNKRVWCSVMHGDKKIIVEDYLDWLETAVLWVTSCVDVLISHLCKPK